MFDMLSQAQMLESYVMWHGKKMPAGGWIRTDPHENDGEHEYSRPYIIKLRDKYRRFCGNNFHEYVVAQTRRLAVRTVWQRIRHFFEKDYSLRIVVLGSFGSKAEAELACASVGMDVGDSPYNSPCMFDEG